MDMTCDQVYSNRKIVLNWRLWHENQIFTSKIGLILLFERGEVMSEFEKMRNNALKQLASEFDFADKLRNVNFPAYLAILAMGTMDNPRSSDGLPMEDELIRQRAGAIAPQLKGLGESEITSVLTALLLEQGLPDNLAEKDEVDISEILRLAGNELGGRQIGIEDARA